MPDFRRMMCDLQSLKGQEIELRVVCNGKPIYHNGIVERVKPFGYILFADGSSSPFAGRDAVQIIRDSEENVIYVCEIPDDWLPTDKKIGELRSYMSE